MKPSPAMQLELDVARLANAIRIIWDKPEVVSPAVWHQQRSIELHAMLEIQQRWGRASGTAREGLPVNFCSYCGKQSNDANPCEQRPCPLRMK